MTLRQDLALLPLWLIQRPLYQRPVAFLPLRPLPITEAKSTKTIFCEGEKTTITTITNGKFFQWQKDEKDIPKILATFGQIDSTISRKYEGTGLGLPLTIKLVQLMNGTFDIQSKIGVGTTITLTFAYDSIM